MCGIIGIASAKPVSGNIIEALKILDSRKDDYLRINQAFGKLSVDKLPNKSSLLSLIPVKTLSEAFEAVF